jgi:hypothetical protein
MKKDPKLATWILLASYSFDQSGNEVEQLINSWLNTYPGKWIIAAVVEAIYQGRYKVSSVSKILESWATRGYPIHHFDHEFADIVCKKLDMCHKEKILYIDQESKFYDHCSNGYENQTDSELKFKNYTHVPNPNIKNLEKLVVKLTA